MLKEHKRIWSGELGYITNTEHRIGLIPSARQFNSLLYRGSPKTRELEQFEVQKQNQAGVIEAKISGLVALVLHSPKKNGYPNFCVDYQQLKTMMVTSYG